MALFDGLTQQLGGATISAISQQLGAGEGQTQTAIQAALPLLISALAKNASNEQGASALAGALDKDHDGSILNDIMGFVSNANSGPGAGILKHLLGGNQQLAQQGVAQSSGLDMGQAAQLMVTLAPLVMGFLGKQKQETGMDVSSLSGFLGGEAQTAKAQTPGMLGMLSNLVDMNNDGSPVDDVLGMLGKFMK